MKGSGMQSERANFLMPDAAGGQIIAIYPYREAQREWLQALVGFSAI